MNVAAVDGRQEHKERRDLLHQLQKRREEEDEVRRLLEEVHRNLDEAQARSYQMERKLDRVLGEHIDCFEKEMGRPHHIMNNMWQKMQSRDTETLNLDRDFEEMMSKVKQAWWNELTNATGFWRQDEDEDP